MGASYDSGLDRNDPIVLGLRPGTIIAYRLLPTDIPLNPNKVWRGKVKWCNDTIILVDMLEPGYNGLNETVTYDQLVGVEYTQ